MDAHARAAQKTEKWLDLWRVHKTILQMLNDRNYVVADAELALKSEEFVEKCGIESKRTILDKTFGKKDDPTEKICVFFRKKLKKVDIRPLYTHMKKIEEAWKAIIVVKRPLSEEVKSFVKEIQEEGIHLGFEFFEDAELMVNVTHHELVPKHEVLTSDQKSRVLERYSLDESQLPKIKMSDPVARYYGVEPGQVMKITRPSQTAGTSIAYRLVIE